MSEFVANTKKRKALGTYFRLIRMLLQDRPISFIFYWLFNILQGFLPALSILLLSQLFEIGGKFIQREATLGTMITIAILYAGVHMFQAIIAMVINIYFNYIQRNLTAALDLRVFQKTQKMKLERFEESTFYDQFQRARSVIGSGKFLNDMRRAVTFVQLLITAFAMISVILHFSSWLVISLVIAAFPITILRLVRGKQFWQLKRFQSPRERMLNYYSTVLSGRQEAQEIRAFDFGDYILSKWCHLRDELREERWAFERKNLIFELLLNTATTEVFAYTLSIAIAIHAVFTGRLEVSEFAATLIALRTFQETVRMAFINFSAAVEGAHYVSDLFEFIDDPEEEDLDQTVQLPKPLMNGIQIKNISFTYPGAENPALEDISVHIQPEERIAIVGANGAGKSTFVKLLLGLYEPAEGSITYDHSDLHAFNVESFRSEVSMVPQDFTRYQLTARDNVAFGEVSSINDEVKILTAMELGGASEFVHALPQQLDTRLGKEFPDSTDLSGGQWQRLVTSRGMMRTPQVMVLDEPTASLDPVQEAEVFQRFAKMSKGRITVMVSHRLASCKLADRIFVLSDRRLIEVGTHDELILLNGEYATMYREQAKWYQ